MPRIVSTTPLIAVLAATLAAPALAADIHISKLTVDPAAADPSTAAATLATELDHGLVYIDWVVAETPPAEGEDDDFMCGELNMGEEAQTYSFGQPNYNHLVISVSAGAADDFPLNLLRCEYTGSGTQMRVRGLYHTHHLSIPTANEIVLRPVETSLETISQLEDAGAFD